jgi:methionyl-tRNA formyltransferase
MVVFFGSPDFAIPSLERLINSKYKPSLVVTQPDRPAGRGKKPKPTPVRATAEQHGLEVMILERFKGSDAAERIRALSPDFLLLVAFGLILPESILEIAARGNINLHASLLPAYRGASPVNGAIVNGDPFTGVSTMEMTASLDAGPIYLQRIVPIDPMENAGSLSAKLAQEGAELLLRTLERIDAGLLEPCAQPEDRVSLAPKLTKEDGNIQWEKDAVAVHNHIRGMNPWPGSFTLYGEIFIKILKAEPLDLMHRKIPPGQIITAAGDELVVACGKGSVAVRRIQVQGKRPLDTGDFLRGFALEEGSRFGSG